jgi:hypothetical protein
MALSREQKIAKARELRAAGWTAKKIAEALEANESTVRNWYLGGNCEDCGAPVDGGDGSRSSTRCPSCASAAQTFWTRELIIEKIRTWAERYGRPPSATDWNPYTLRRRPGMTDATKERKLKRFQDDDWPYTNYVIARFGSWAAGLRAAGFESNPPGFAGHWDEAA